MLSVIPDVLKLWYWPNTLHFISAPLTLGKLFASLKIMANTPAKSQQMAQIDMKTEFPKLSETDQHYIKKWENVNATRAKRAISMRSNNRYTGWIIAGFALSICILSHVCVTLFDKVVLTAVARSLISFTTFVGYGFYRGGGGCCNILDYFVLYLLYGRGLSTAWVSGILILMYAWTSAVLRQLICNTSQCSEL